MKKEGEPESGELVWDVRVEEREQAAHVGHTGHLQDREIHGEGAISSSCDAIGQRAVLIRQ